MIEEKTKEPQSQAPAAPVKGREKLRSFWAKVQISGLLRRHRFRRKTQRHMNDVAKKLRASENIDKNMIDKTEYPQTAEIERRCVNIIAKLWHSPEPPYCTGTSTVGSSEACMLGGIAALKRWQKRRRVSL